MPTSKYDIFPAFPLQKGNIESGYASLAKWCSGSRIIVIDGYIGVDWDDFRLRLQQALDFLGISAHWIDFREYFRSPEEIEKLVAPFLGGDDLIFGSRTHLRMEDFINPAMDVQLQFRENYPLNVLYGCGCFAAGTEGKKIYLDLPKNEIQRRSRQGLITNLGCNKPSKAREMYKRFYFVDWVVLNRHKQKYISKVDLFADVQQQHQVRWAEGDNIRLSLSVMSRNYFRVRPWFEPGIWGGSWIKNHIEGISTGVPNYAWSFELITPENGLMFEKDGYLLEISFDWLMFQEAERVLGDGYQRFGTEFPIRFDFLDTFDGGNLSIQCHPRPEYTKQHFQEDFTQEESYYILDTKDDAQVYLGFQEDIDPETFAEALSNSINNASPLEVDKYVMKHPASRHDLFLIPYATIHGSGKNNLVLEISTTPYIFTFKLYDWLRPDLDGNPRPLNIHRGLENLDFSRKGDIVKKELLSVPCLISEGQDWQCWQLPTHETHLYSIRRYHIKTTVCIQNNNKFHVLSLVEGDQIEISTENGMTHIFNFAETFVIPAAAQSYRVKNMSDTPVRLIQAFLK